MTILFQLHRHSLLTLHLHEGKLCFALPAVILNFSFLTRNSAKSISRIGFLSNILISISIASLFGTVSHAVCGLPGPRGPSQKRSMLAAILSEAFSLAKKLL